MGALSSCGGSVLMLTSGVGGNDLPAKGGGLRAVVRISGTGRLAGSSNDLAPLTISLYVEEDWTSERN